MRALVIVFTSFAGMFAFGFLLAGYATLLSLDQSELADFRRRSEEHLKPGLLRGVEHHFWMRREVMPLRRIIEHWRTRPDVRRTTWLGCACLAVAIIGASAL